MTDTFTPPRIDPRFTRRRVDVQRANGRRRLRLLILTGSVVLVAGLAAGSFVTPLWKVRHVRIQVHGPVSGTRIEALAGLDHQRLMINVDPAQITARLDALPILGGARVRLEWPGTVSIQVGVRRPVAQVPLGSTTWATVDATGRILAYVSSQIPGVPVIRQPGPVPAAGGWLPSTLGPAVAPGTPATEEVDMDAPSGSTQVPNSVEAALVAMQVMPASVKAEVINATVTPTGALTLSVLPAGFAAGSIAVNLGDGSLLNEKVSALVTLVTQSNLSNVTQIDLTVPDRPALLTAR